MQSDFCGAGGYVDVMGYDLALMRAPIPAIHAVLKALRSLRGTPREMHVMHTREGHSPDLSDAPFNKVDCSHIFFFFFRFRLIF
jgi:nicotinamidase-related amidase